MKNEVRTANTTVVKNLLCKKQLFSISPSVPKHPKLNPNLKWSVQDHNGISKKLQFAPYLLIQGVVAFPGTTTGAPSKLWGGPSLGRTKLIKDFHQENRVSEPPRLLKRPLKVQWPQGTVQPHPQRRNYNLETMKSTKMSILKMSSRTLKKKERLF